MFQSNRNETTKSSAMDPNKPKVAWSNDSKKTKKHQDGYRLIMKDFLENTSLHGLKYIGFERFTIFERAFFGLSFVLVLLLSVYFISNVYVRWSRTPIIVTLSAKSTTITSIPFPTVTICNLNRARKSVIYKISNGTIDNDLIQNTCFEEYANVSGSNAHIDNYEWFTYRKYLVDTSQPCSEMLERCSFGLEDVDCMKIFDTVLSDEGLCCSFNAVDPQFLYVNPTNASINFDEDEPDQRLIPIDWTPTTGYANESIRQKALPRPAPGSGSHLGLYVILNANISDYFCSSTESAGFKILLHNPTETPRISDYGLLVSTGRQTRVFVSPKINTASYLVKKVPPSSRRCYFPNEMKLDFFRTYTGKNCEMECYSRVIEKECGCVIYYMPRLNESTKVCNHGQNKCYNPLRISLERGENKKYNCKCFSACDEINYSGTLSTAPLMSHPDPASDLANYSTETILQDLAVLEVFYDDSSYRSYVRDEFVGFTEFLSNTGGLLGLFMGFSMVSLVEIFYFIALRPYFSRFSPENNQKSTSHGVSTVSKLKLKNQPNRLYAREYLNNHVDPSLPFYRQNFPNIDVKLWKPTPFVH